jgi:hypothetical protein
MIERVYYINEVAGENTGPREKNLAECQVFIASKCSHIIPIALKSGYIALLNCICCGEARLRCR